MKIGILSFWGSENNYGQLLQLYGLSQYLSNRGHVVEIIRYNTHTIQELTNPKRFRRIVKVLNPIKLSRYIASMIHSRKQIKYAKQHPRSFSNFRETYLDFSSRCFNSIEELRTDTPDWEVLICGSDQVWNFSRQDACSFSVIDAYSLAFGSQTVLRLSYAPSMGFSGISEIHGKRLADNLQWFLGISVREKQAIDILENFGINDVVWVPDPTMLLGPEGYAKLISTGDKYKVSFFLYGLISPSIISGKDIAKKLLNLNQTFEYVGANGVVDKELTCFPTIEEWLSYISGSETIITNSFHGCIFSILFQKNFYYYPLLPNKEGHVDTRIDSLLGRLGIEGRAIRSEEELTEMIGKPHKPIDWESVKINQDEFVLIGKNFLAKHLGRNEE